jgi:hypothetical protein
MLATAKPKIFKTSDSIRKSKLEIWTITNPAAVNLLNCVELLRIGL